jgi:hypothetical protein
MDPRTNPYAPGAGVPPPELAGRGDIVERVAVALHRTRAKRAARGFVLYGLRGVGKTVLLNKMSLDAEAAGHTAVRVEAPEEALRTGLLKLNRGEATKEKVHSALRVLAGFIGAVKVKYADVEVAIDADKLLGVGDSGNLESDLGDLLTAVGEAAQERNTAVVLFIDELQYVAEDELGMLLSALHRVSQAQLPIAMVAAGLPQLLGLSGRAKSYAERLLEFVPIDRLDDEAAKSALREPAVREGVAFEDAAVATILKQTQGYPYFLQEWGKHSWDRAERSPIQASDAADATITALAELDGSFFRVRFDRLTPAEKRYMRGMAELGPGPHRSGDIARQLGNKVESVAPLRSGLIAKGMIYSPNHGDTAFTVPLFDGFMKRVMPTL